MQKGGGKKGAKGGGQKWGKRGQKGGYMGTHAKMTGQKGCKKGAKRVQKECKKGAKRRLKGCKKGAKRRQKGGKKEAKKGQKGGVGRLVIDPLNSGKWYTSLILPNLTLVYTGDSRC